MKYYIQLLAILSYSCGVFGGPGCFFDGKTYAVGESILAACAKVTCDSDDVWSTTNAIDPNCSRCRAIDSQHITTFDNSKVPYVWPGTCKYALAEHVSDWNSPDSSPPEFGVYANFRTCGEKSNYTCLNFTTYQTNYCNVSVDIDHLTLDIMDSTGVLVAFPRLGPNPQPLMSGTTKYPLLTWRHRKCIRIMGRGLLIQICNQITYVFAHAKYHGKLGGLCGFFNGKSEDDHRSRDGTFYPLIKYPKGFPPTWKTCDSPADCPNQQSGKEGNCEREEEDCSYYLDEYCFLSYNERDAFRDTCTTSICSFPEDKDFLLELIIEACNFEYRIDN